jgi:Luciferase-like monooxygenase
VKVGIALAWHCLAWEELVGLVARAEELGFDTAYIDGDISQLALRHETDVLDGWTATTALVARTRRIRIASIRLVQHWNAAHLAQVMATAERIAPGRSHFFASIGDRPEDRAWGLPLLPASERVAWLDETLDAVRALWRGESVTRRGRFVTLEGELARACRAERRDPAEIRRRLWIFARPEPLSRSEALAEFRRWNPWFRDLSDAELAPALAVGKPAECRERIASLAADLDLEMPVIDLSGLTADRAREALEALPAGDIR